MAVNSALPQLHVLRLSGYSILDQLYLEEALLRTHTGNWLLLNEGTPDAIVMGISGKRERLINAERMSASPVPLIRRYSGGGTVFVDSNTLFVTFICNHDELQGSPSYPKAILHWTKQFYAPLFPVSGFQIAENDYAYEGRKFGGNAQYLTKDRWVHHTTLLWDFDAAKMDYLLLPEKRPKYRVDRCHADFLHRLCDLRSSKEDFLERFVEQAEQVFQVLAVPLSQATLALNIPHRRSTHVVI